MNAALLPRLGGRFAVAAAFLSLAACGGDGPVGVDEQATTSTGCVLTRAALDPGESVVLGPDKRCVELTNAGSRYMVGVVHTGTVATSTAPFQLTGSVRGASAAPTMQPLASLATVDARTTGSGPMSDDGAASHARVQAHQRILEINRTLRSRLGTSLRSRNVAASPSAPGLALNEAASAPTTGLRAIGDTATLRIPDIDVSNACSKYFDVKTRVAYVGQRAIILEDQAAPLAGQMDDTYRAIGQEFDTVMWPILTTYFGDPIRADATLDDNDRIIMLFSPVVNNNFDGIAGFVIGCDFYSRTELPASNEGEVFYAMVPTSLTGPMTSAESRDGWLRTMRSTLIHEAKHIVSFAERIMADYEPEDSWLEEGTARHAEELYARALSGATWKGNVGYDALACEVRPSVSACFGRPYVMFKHFDGLYDALASNGTRTPLGKADPDDYTFYATAWAMIRWAADVAPNEAEFLKALTRGPRVGVANLAAATGRTWDEIVADWTMAMALDDVVPGFTPDRQQRVGSWNMRSVYAGMAKDFPEYYPSYPVRPNARTYGNFVLQNGTVRAGTGALTELTGTWAGPQVLEIEAAGGGAPAPNLRLVVTRVQ